MPITAGAKKAHRASKRKQVFNVRRKGAMKDAIKDIEKALSTGDTKTAEAKVPEAYKAIDKALKRGIIKPNTAARKKSRLVATIKKAK